MHVVTLLRWWRDRHSSQSAPVRPYRRHTGPLCSRPVSSLWRINVGDAPPPAKIRSSAESAAPLVTAIGSEPHSDPARHVFPRWRVICGAGATGARESTSTWVW